MTRSDSTLIICGHGTTEFGNTRVLSYVDPGLSRLGFEEAISLGHNLVSLVRYLRLQGVLAVVPDLVVSGPTRRAAQSAGVVADIFGGVLAPTQLSINEHLTEIDLGEAAGLTRQQAIQRFPKAFFGLAHLSDRSVRMPGRTSESLDELAERVVELGWKAVARQTLGRSAIAVTNAFARHVGLMHLNIERPRELDDVLSAPDRFWVLTYDRGRDQLSHVQSGRFDVLRDAEDSEQGIYYTEFPVNPTRRLPGEG